MKKLFLLILWFSFYQTVYAQITLTGNRYMQNFDSIGNGLPAGIHVRFGATSTSPGTDSSFVAGRAPASWMSTSRGFKNFASADGLFSSTPLLVQHGAADRALGVRQTSTSGWDPGVAFVVQLSNTTGFRSLRMSFRLQSLDSSSERSVTWTVDYAIGAFPSKYFPAATISMQPVTGGQSFSNDSISIQFDSLLDNRGEPVWIRIISLKGSSGTGSRPSTAIDDLILTYETTAPDTIPPLLLSTHPAHGSILQASSMMWMTFSENIYPGDSGILIRRSADSSIAYIVRAHEMVFSQNKVGWSLPSLPFNASYFTEVSPKSLKDAAGNYFTGFTGAGAWSFYTPSAPSVVYNFNNCLASDSIFNGWQRFSTTGEARWHCTGDGIAASNGIAINGFQNGAMLNDDWLVSPPMNLTGYTIPLLSLMIRAAYGGPQITLLASTDYVTGMPLSSATWRPVNMYLPPAIHQLWYSAGVSSLLPFQSPQTVIAIRYQSSPEDGAAQIILDDIQVRDTVALPQPRLYPVDKVVNFDYVPSGSYSMQRSFRFRILHATGPLTITAPPHFQLSRDSVHFGSSIVYPPEELTGEIRTFVRFISPATRSSVWGDLHFTTAGLNESCIELAGNTIEPAQTLDIVNWNLKWFGGAQGPADPSLQQKNVKRIMDSLNADIYAFTEIVDVNLFSGLVQFLPGYAYAVSDYASAAPNPSSGNYAQAQKLAFIYRTSLVKNLRVRGLMKGSATAASNWSSGRVPFLMEADITHGNTIDRYYFILIHAKSGDTESDYDRRKAGVRELKDTLDAFFADKKLVILGDFNDDLDSTIVLSVQPRLSSFDILVQDSTDQDHFRSVTLPLSGAGLNSTVSYPDMIDHVILSNEVAVHYLPRSARLFSEVESWISGYGSTTSDHYPVMSRIQLPLSTGIPPLSGGMPWLAIEPNPVVGSLAFRLHPLPGTFSFQVLDMAGRVRYHSIRKKVTGVPVSEHISLSGWSPGMYLLMVRNNSSLITRKFIRL